MAARLKVYEADLDGVNRWVVAAPSQKAALEAWGVRQNLFLLGEAKVAVDDAAISAALARPGEPLRAPKSGQGPFRPLAEPDVAGWTAAAKAIGAKKPKAGKPAPPDDRKLMAARAALKVFEAEAEERLADLARREAAAADARKQETRAIKKRRDELNADIEREAAALKSA